MLDPVHRAFSWTYRALAAEPAAVFRKLSHHPGPHVGIPAAARITGLEEAQLRTHLDHLAEPNLLDEPTPGRYGFHDLLRRYAADLCDQFDGEDDVRTARRRLVDWYVSGARRANRLLNP